MADKKEKKVEEKKAKVVAEEKPLIGMIMEDEDGRKYFWTEKSGMDKPIKIYK